MQARAHFFPRGRMARALARGSGFRLHPWLDNPLRSVI